MTTCILLTKEDIETRPIGINYEIKTKEGLVINFTSDAIDELISDIAAIRYFQSKEAAEKVK